MLRSCDASASELAINRTRKGGPDSGAVLSGATIISPGAESNEHTPRFPVQQATLKDSLKAYNIFRKHAKNRVAFHAKPKRLDVRCHE
jgi:hypothetical protein